MYECESNDKQNVDLQLNPNECAMLLDFELHSVHAESSEIIMYSTLNTAFQQRLSNYCSFESL